MKINEHLFWSKVEKLSDFECWNWKASKNRDGYGNFAVGKNAIGKKKKENAHRVSFFLAHGEIPNGYSVCHKCDNPSCVNPSHLFLGSHRANMADAKSKGRITQGKLSEEQRQYIKASKKPSPVLAKEFSVSGRAIGYIRSR